MTDNTQQWAPVAATVREALARKARPHTSPAGGLRAWRPRYDESVLAVCGVTGSVGATTVSLAVASVAALTGPARLIECAPPSRSGLVAAADSELGAGRGGWSRGQRDELTLIRRTAESLFDAPPPPPEEDGMFTVLDAGDLLAERSAALSLAVEEVSGWVIVAEASVPCLRQLELALVRSPARRPTLAIIGAPPGRWSRPLVSAVQPRTRALIDSGRSVTFRYDRRLAITGLTPDPLPNHITAAARRLLLFPEGLFE